MKFAFITGVSKGLGKSTAAFFLESQINVIGVSRTDNKELVKIAEENNYSCDLGKRSDVRTMLDAVLKQIDHYGASVIYIVNNAATIEPIDPLFKVNDDELQNHFTVNVITPMVILNTFIKHYRAERGMIIGVNVTSGAANRPIFGWSAYGSSKASIDAYTKTAALEEESLRSGNKIIGFNPGVMDTKMQEYIRSQDEQSFQDVEIFKSLKKNKILKDTDIIAGLLVDILTDEVNIENGKIYDVKDYF